MPYEHSLMSSIIASVFPWFASRQGSVLARSGVWVLGLLLAWVSLSAQEVGLSVVTAGTDLRVRAEAPPTTVRLVWEAAPRLAPEDWTVVSVDTDAMGREAWIHELGSLGDAGFFRVRAYATPGFNARVDRVIRAVRADRPEAILLEASGVLGSMVMELPEDSAVRVVLRVSGGTVVATQADPFGEPQIDFRAMPWLGSADLPWPVAKNLEEAESLMRRAGYGPDYRSVTLRRPVYPGMTEPYFIFGMAGNGFVFVGTVTGQVSWQN